MWNVAGGSGRKVSVSCGMSFYIISMVDICATGIEQHFYVAINFRAVMDTIWRDLRFAARGMRKSVAFTAAAVLTLALGIGANTAMFSVIRAVMLQPLDFREPDRLVFLSVENAARGVHDGQFGLPQFEGIRAQARSLDGLGAYGVNPETLSISGDGREPEALRAARVSGNFLDVLGVHPILGRGFFPEEDRRGGPCVAMISA